MVDLRPCPDCRRHVAATEASCPFCGTTLSLAGPAPELPRGRLTRAAVFAAGALAVAGAAGAACGGKNKGAENAGGGGGDVVDASTSPAVDAPVAAPDHPAPMPYGAPPARRRIV